MKAHIFCDVLNSKGRRCGKIAGFHLDVKDGRRMHLCRHCNAPPADVPLCEHFEPKPHFMLARGRRVVGTMCPGPVVTLTPDPGDPQ